MKILYEDADLVVCEKPIGVLSQAGKEGEDTMLARLDAYFAEKGASTRAFVLHRLDREVGGVTVYAKNAQACADMSALIAERRLEKTYLAVCHGDVTQTLGEEGRLVDLLFHDTSKNKSFVAKRMRRGVKEARLAFSVSGTVKCENEAYSLLKITLETGRTHQIRVQFSSRGYPLVGDARYGSHERRVTIALFSHRIAFSYPANKGERAFSLPSPQGFPWDLFEGKRLL